ncbi:ABC transporter ATP-binding protein [Haloferax mediterranei ATCC 33500]|uniref:Molybdate/tungstate import ATP-binding protein WtpC n=1 Tax=Haloferax mediterranei (strain ATCC 33500 / DSM 1411 / JCM 8866 / NBRC 14739 / NCIMB 2177 / R-4) TaxID=523841 RepID=I3R0K3_HALMT|nr:ABC transporter ATP-binding protein [Haloferax mediterranei]AFK17763.1 thiamine ABC transporter ATP-binding protein [Haloferax mediterranei ATCC 33500]AHZ22805.1 spermidine/putrescine ABC transporter ATP-binding protein [Haloferax mediterranei ATCC 33500]EMA02965.1 thiamine ABC transporter ATP-binding protein [Haloferax mediterranei ATCC 33500]MDX5987852.1 ABC transporter ATP-binding protein [Haloferax mediterranei ATCC 33500]QCQ74328.1 ABC transporter ATP-binding protein [Haloferax mediter
MRLELDDVSKRYGTATALDSVSLSVGEGEFFTLVGPSGCGKTTTLRCIAGFESPTEGAVRFDGESMAGVPPESRGVGVVFQNYALFPHLTVGENVAYGLRFTDPPGGATRDERVAELLELVDLSGFEDRDPDSLSGGQQQRVALARALAPGPDLLLLDEPMSALDARLRDRLRRQVKRIQSELGVTTVYVTHDQSEALAVSDRVAVLNRGRVEQVGNPRDVYHRPQTRFVAEFVGENNVLDAVVESRPETGGLRVGTEDQVFTLSEGGRTFGESLSPSTSDAAPGESITFCVRPEALRVGAGQNRIRGTIVDAEFQGATTRIRLDWSGTEVSVTIDDDTERGDGRFELGSELEVGFNPDASHIVE